MLLPKLIYGQAHYELPIADSIVPIDIISLDGNYINIVSQNGIYELQGTTLALISSFDKIELTYNTQSLSTENSSRYGYAYPAIQGGYLTIYSKDSITYSYLSGVPQSVANKSYGTEIKWDSETYIVHDNTFQLIAEEPLPADSMDINETANNIIDTHQYNDSISFAINDNTLYRQTNHLTKKIFQIDNKSSEELVAVFIDKNNYKWLLTNERIIIIPREELIYSPLPHSTSNYSLYATDGILYAIDASNVYQYINEDWVLRRYIELPIQRPLSHENTDTPAEPNFSYLEHEGKVITAHQSGIHISRNDIVEFDKPIAIGESTNQFIENGRYFYFAESSIFNLDISDPTQEGMITLMKSTIIDMINYDNELIVLNSKSLIFLDKSSILRNRIKINRVIPFPNPITSGSLTLHNQHIFIATKEGIIKVLNNDHTPMTLPKLSINTANNNGIPRFKNSNFFTDNINYTYFIRSEKANKILWSKQPTIDIEVDGITTYRVLAKMRDDVFLQDIYSENIEITVGTESLVDRLIKIISAILATLLILWAIRKWIMRE